ncbi:MAG: peptide deformylase [Oscillospiraceae bacterium]
MALRKILTQGESSLEKVCRPVERFDRRLHILLDDMKETLAEANGVGLAAPQVGILRRAVIVVDEQDQMIELVNPVIIRQEGEQDGLEGCLSVPGMYGKVKRPNYVIVRAQDRDGNPFEVSGEGIVARCFCHETEHLDGHLFVEHTGRLYTLEELDAMEADGEELQ